MEEGIKDIEGKNETEIKSSEVASTPTQDSPGEMVKQKKSAPPSQEESSSSESESDDTSSASTPAPTPASKKSSKKLVANITPTPTHAGKRSSQKTIAASASNVTHPAMKRMGRRADEVEQLYIQNEAENFSSPQTSFEIIGGTPTGESELSLDTDDGVRFAWDSIQDKDTYKAMRDAALIENVSGDYIEVRCVECEKSVAKAEILRTCVLFYENVCHRCGLNISRRWEDFFRQRKDINEYQRDIFGTKFCAETKMKHADILYFMELGGNEAVLYGKDKARTFYQTAYCSDQHKNMDWYYWVLHTLCWRESNTRAIVVEFFHFAVVPHLFNMWPEKSRMISYVGSSKQQEILVNPSWKTYSKIYRLLADFITSDVFFKYPRLSNLFNTTTSKTCMTSGWGMKKNRMYHFPNDEKPEGLFKDE